MPNMLEKYLSSGKLDHLLAKSLRESRNLYSYPKVRLLPSTSPTEFKISARLWAKPDEETSNQQTDLFLDEYHQKLLTSEDPAENLLGTASVIFWGYYTFSKSYAINKLKWHLDGGKLKIASTPELVHKKLNKVHAEPDPGKAISFLHGLSQLGSIPFASKVIAFSRPDSSGIYDNQIHKGLSKRGWDTFEVLKPRIGRVNEPGVQLAYSRWCNFLTTLSGLMNEEIENRSDFRWTDSTGRLCHWRAIDIERALFFYLKTHR